MIKALIKRPAQDDLVVLGLSRGNVDRLTAGQPVLVRGQELGLDLDVSIVFGETEQAIADELRAAGVEVAPFDDPKPGERRRVG